MAPIWRQNARYRELTFTPFTHIDLQKKGLTIDDLLAGLEAGRTQARQDFGVEICWIFDLPRNVSFRPDHSYDPHPAERTLAYALAGQEQGVVGLGLGGFEVEAPPEPLPMPLLRPRRRACFPFPMRAKPWAPPAYGAPSPPAGGSHWPRRTRHGGSRVVGPAQERQIVLEVNPTSNICLHVYDCLAEHPFPQLDQMELVTVNSDDPALFNTSLCQEYAVLAAAFGYGQADLARIARSRYSGPQLAEEPSAAARRV